MPYIISFRNPKSPDGRAVRYVEIDWGMTIVARGPKGKAAATRFASKKEALAEARARLHPGDQVTILEVKR